MTVHRIAGAWRAIHRFCAAQVEVQERLFLLNRPWERDILHWADGELHGRLPPPGDGRRHGVTTGGWCACPRGTSRPGTMPA
jgi:hypothetical protein